MPSASTGASCSGYIPASKAIHNMADENIETGAPEGVADGNDVSALQARIDELEAAKTKAERNAQTFQNEAMERKRKLERFKDVDPDEYARLKTDFGSMSGEDVAQFRAALDVAKTEEERRLLTERGLEGYLEHHTSQRLDADKKAHEKNLGELQAQWDADKAKVDALTSKVNGMRLKTDLFGAWHDKLQDSAKEDAQSAAERSAKFDENGEITWTIDGEEIFGEGGKPATADVWLARMTEKRPHWLKTSHSVRAPGSPGGVAPKDNPYIGGTLGEQMRLERDNPELAARLKAAANTS